MVDATSFLTQKVFILTQRAQRAQSSHRGFYSHRNLIFIVIGANIFP